MASGDLTSTQLPTQTSPSTFFDGVDDDVQLPTSNFLSLQNFTIEMWILPLNMNGATNMGFFSMNTASSLKAHCFKWNGNNNIYFRTINSAVVQHDTKVLYSTAGIIDNAWNHIAFVYDGVKKYIYVNGVEAASDAYTETLLDEKGVNFIGSTASATYFMRGFIRHVKLYNRGLTAAEILSTYTKPQNYQGLLCKWNLETDYVDEINALNGTNDGTIQVGQTAFDDLQAAINTTNLAATTDKIHIIPIHGRDKSLWAWKVARTV